jgi:hypothetical protein
VAHPAQALLLWGDSHAASFSEGLRQQHGDVMQYTASLCPPILGVDFRDRPNCRSINNFVLDQIRRLQPHEIWLLGTWNAYGPLASPQAIESTLSQIRMASPASQITLMGGLPDWPRPLPVVAMRSGVILDRERALPMSTLAQLRQVDGELEPVAAAAGVRFLSALRALCSDQQCPVVTAYAGHFDLVAWDRSHLTQAGSMLLAKRLLPGPPAAAAR